MAVPSGRKPDPKTGSGKASALEKKSPTGKLPASDAPAPSGAHKAISGKTEPARKAPSGKAGAVRAPSGKAPATTTSSRRAVPMPTGGGGKPKGSIVVTCRECGEEWTMDPAKAQALETISCPLCEHKAQAPSDDILHQIALYKGIEAGHLRMALTSLATGLFAVAIWLVVTSDPLKAAQPALFYGPVFVAVLGLLGTLFFGAKYENARWETYF
jgi:DNA-directed RNA polymerase subunit RPC12/RpoP